MGSEPVLDCGGAVASPEVEALGDGDIVSMILCRLERLRASGCDEPECVVLAARFDVELEQAASLVRRGCPPGLALRILL